LGKIKDVTHSYHSGLLIVAIALIAGGIIGIAVSRPGRNSPDKRPLQALQ
ncbi:MFS transporter, partial [Pluralibacter gergoviae]|nr:MFS transporter [Pluralibacter gergoviae]